MKTLVWLAVFLLLLQGIVLASYGYRKTTGDIYIESYDSQFKKQLDEMPQAYRADEYRARYEQCDENHNCKNLTGTSRAPGLKNDFKMISLLSHDPIAQG